MEINRVMFCIFSHISAMIIEFSYTILNVAVDFSSILKLTILSAFQVLRNIEFSFSKSYVTWSDKTGLIAYFKAQRNNGFNNSGCYNSPMAEVTPTNFSHVLQ